MTRHALAFTEMAVADAVIHGDRDRILGFDPVREGPIALQLGGSHPQKLAQAAVIGADMGYDEINLNVGCPSDRVQGGHFGACLMREPALVADCVAAMAARVSVPVTVKCRIGVDDQDPNIVLPDFVDQMATAGVGRLYIHARKAWLKGLSPKDNRTIPPLDYDLVRAIKHDRPGLQICLNGGLGDVAHGLREMAAGHDGPSQLGSSPTGPADADGLDGMMLGRAAYETPWILAEVDGRVFDDQRVVHIGEVLDGVIALASEAHGLGLPVHVVTRHVMGLFHGRPGARSWRRALSDIGRNGGVGPAAIAQAARLVDIHAA